MSRRHFCYDSPLMRYDYGSLALVPVGAAAQQPPELMHSCKATNHESMCHCIATVPVESAAVDAQGWSRC
jgi:hypothetical protein